MRLQYGWRAREAFRRTSVQCVRASSLPHNQPTHRTVDPQHPSHTVTNNTESQNGLSRRDALSLAMISAGAIHAGRVAPANAADDVSVHATSVVASALPVNMRAATVSAFGEADIVISVSETSVPSSGLADGSGKMLIRVLACSTSPGDWRTYRGDVDFVRRPAFPYVPSGDVCGIVVQVDEACPRFQIGDCVVATWKETPLGGMAEYALVDCELAIHKPAGMSALEAAAFPNSSLHALDVLREANITPGERVLVLGGSGGVGTALIQLLKRRSHASFIATTSTQAELMLSLGADRVVNYESEHWWELPEFMSQPFDVVLDCAEGLQGWERAKRSTAVKRGVAGGRFVAISSDEPRMQIHNAQDMASFTSTMLLREPFSQLRSASMPYWHMYLGGATPDSLAELSTVAEGGWFRVITDPRGPFPFTTEGVRAAYNLQASFHAHGKVVVQVTQEDPQQ